MNIRWNIILGVIALALLGWYYSLNQDHSDLQSLIKSLIARNTSVIKWKPLYSRLKVKTISRDFDKVEYYTQDGHTDFISPLVYLLMSL